MRAPSFLIVAGLVLIAAVLMNGSHSASSRPALGLSSGAAAAQTALDCDGEPCDAVRRGLRAFFDRRLDGLGGNGRSCADCHMAIDRFQLSPASVEARFHLLQLRRRSDPLADDPLFRAIDADDFRINGEQADDFSNLRQNGLVRVTLPLPSNIALVDSTTGLALPDATVDVWRMVPSVNDVALTGPDGGSPWPREPNPTGGYQLDARRDTLQAQAQGALIDHASITGLVPQELLDDLASFQRVLFTSHRVRTLAAAIREGASPLPDPDAPLNPLEEQGKAVFDRACAHCHGGPGQSTPQRTPVGQIGRFHDIASQCPRPVDTEPIARFAFAPCPDRLARNARTYEITLPNGTKIRRTSSDPGRALLTGFVGGPPPADDWNKFDMPGLRGISQTAPYFHNNSAATLEDVVDHYIELFNRIRANQPPNVFPPVASTDGRTFDRQPTPEERGALLAYLRKL